MNTGIFDSHAHYDDAAFDEDRETLLASLPAAGISKVVNIGSTIEGSHKCVLLADKYDYIYAAIGIHPSEIRGVTEEDMQWIGATAERERKVVAIGEIGLDYYWDKDNRDEQISFFERQMDMARKLGLPFVVHSRDAAKDTYEVMKAADAGSIGGVVHCFSYAKEEARKYLDMGFYIGIGGVLTFKNGIKMKEVCEYTPLDRILLETDSPYLAPVPNRGKRNTSLNLPLVVAEMARIKGVSEEEIISVTYKNACRMYAINA